MANLESETMWLHDEIVDGEMIQDIRNNYYQEFSMSVHQNGDSYDISYRRPGPLEFRPLAFIGVFNCTTGAIRLRGPAQDRTATVHLAVKPEPTDCVKFYIRVVDGSSQAMYLPVITWSK